MAVSIAQLRQAFATRIALLSGWWEAPVPYELFGPSHVPDAVPAPKAHQAFSVGTPSTPEYAWRQKASEGAYAKTDVRVRFLARHTPGVTTALASVDAATAAEHVLIKQLMAAPTWPTSFQLALLSSTRSCPAPGEWFVIEVAFECHHQFALQ